jgi:hypothetical protein
MNYIFEHGLWESDFFLNEILPKGNVEYIRTDTIENTQKTCDVFAFACRVHNFVNIKNTIQRIKPKIVIMTSDEFHQENNSIYNELGNECELFLRQYHHPGNTYTPNTIHIPLGYTNGCKIFTQPKKLKWSWFGDIKNDRIEMLNQFRQLTPHLTGNSLSKELMCKSYAQSLFVPCGRGNSSLDCFRLYEASMNGAIPVVVGDEEEVNNTFKYEQNPPWIFAKSWKEAYNNCEDLLNEENQLKEMQINIFSWWKNRISSVRSRVSQVK